MRLAGCGPLQFISQELHWAIIVFRIAEDSKTKLRIRKYVVMQVQNKLLNVSTGTQRDVSTFISVEPTWLKRKSGRDPAMVSTWQQDFRIFSGFPPRCLVHDQLSNTKHVHHSFCFLVVAPLVRMSWDLKRRNYIGDKMRKEAKWQVGPITIVGELKTRRQK